MALAEGEEAQAEALLKIECKTNLESSTDTILFQVINILVAFGIQSDFLIYFFLIPFLSSIPVKPSFTLAIIHVKEILIRRSWTQMFPAGL